MTFAVGDRVVRNPVTMPDADAEVGVVSSCAFGTVSVRWPSDSAAPYTYPLDHIKPAPVLPPPRRWQRVDGHLVDSGRGLACAVSRPVEALPREADRTTLGVAACCPTCGRLIDQPEAIGTVA